MVILHLHINKAALTCKICQTNRNNVRWRSVMPWALKGKEGGDYTGGCQVTTPAKNWGWWRDMAHGGIMRRRGKAGGNSVNDAWRLLRLWKADRGGKGLGVSTPGTHELGMVKFPSDFFFIKLNYSPDFECYFRNGGTSYNTIYQDLHKNDSNFITLLPGGM